MRGARQWARIAPFLYVRSDGLRVHTGGHISMPLPGHPSWLVLWSAFMISDTIDPLWKRCKLMEPKFRRALLLYTDIRWPLDEAASFQTSP
ncbi:hypothetical protein LCGC14_0436880 [marine sediment metagenome]|uniref:Uncharacterized protein n=1 Tax=marine sediment metagenome TaxID=412755 RepID=A0A0F9SST4_9ZZZZ